MKENPAFLGRVMHEGFYIFKNSGYLSRVLGYTVNIENLVEHLISTTPLGVEIKSRRNLIVSFFQIFFFGEIYRVIMQETTQSTSQTKIFMTLEAQGVESKSVRELMQAWRVEILYRRDFLYVQY